MRTPLATFLILLVVQGDPLTEVPKLIERLQSPDFQERQEAARLLKEIGPPALPLLEQAAKDPDAEVMTRSRDLVRQIRLRQALGVRLLREFPGIDDRLDTPESRAWTLEFFKILDERGKGKSLTGLLPSNLEPLADRAFAGAQGVGEIARLIQSCSDLGLRSAFPALRQLAENGGGADQSLTVPAMRAMTRVDAPRALPILLSYLTPGNGMRLQVLQLLRIRPGPAKVVETVCPLLQDPEALVRSEAALLLGAARDVRSVAGIEALLGDANPEVRLAALIAFQNLPMKESSGAVRLLLKDVDPNVRKEAIRSLALLASEEAAPEIEVLARESNDKGIQAEAAEALGFLNRRQAADTLVKLSESPDKEVRRAVLGALFRLGAQSAAVELAKSLLKTKDAEMMRIAAESLGNMGIQESVGAILAAVPGCPPEALPALVRTLWDLADPRAVPVLESLLEDQDSEVRRAVRSALARIKAAGKAPAVKSPRLPANPEGLLKATEDPKPRVRADALQDLYLLNMPVPEDRLATLLSDPDERVRKEALLLTSQFGFASLLPRLRSCTQDASIQIFSEALKGLAWRGESADRELLKGRMNEFLAALAICNGLAARTDGLFQDLLEELLLHEDGAVRHRAGEALCRRGSSIGVPAVLSQESGFFALNALRTPDRFKLLATTPTVGPHEGTCRELLNRAGNAGGFHVDLPPSLSNMGRPWWDCPLPFSSRWKRVTLLDDVISALNELYNGVGLYEVVLETDRLRILSREDAKRFWQRWWSNLNK